MRLSLKVNVFTRVLGFSALVLGAVVTAGGVYAAQEQAKPNLVQLPAQPVGVSFPTNGWQVEDGKSAKIAAIANSAFDNSNKSLGETRALLVIKGGKIIYENYGKGYDKDSKLISWSMGKSILSALVGIEIAQNKMKLDDAINDPHYKDGDTRRKITYKQALNMTDGLDWREENYSDPINNDAAIMLFGAGKEDVVKYVTSRKQKHDAGTYWNYSSGTSNMVAAGASRALGPRDIKDPTGRARFRNFIYTELFQKLGMKDTAAEFDAAGNLYASSFFYATARDYAKFGLLFLRDGVWDGKRILPQGYVDFVRTPVEAQNAANYGAHWWLNFKDRKPLLKNSPEDAFMARGHQGQLVVVIPSKDMVVVRLGLSPDENSWQAIGEYMDKVIAAAD